MQNGNNDRGQLKVLNDARRTSELAHKQTTKQYEEALSHYLKMGDKKIKFDDWCQKYDQTYLSSLNESAAADGAFQYQLNLYYGPESTLLSDQLSKLKSGLESFARRNG
jgi:hypothetical protein